MKCHWSLISIYEWNWKLGINTMQFSVEIASVVAGLQLWLQLWSKQFTNCKKVLIIWVVYYLNGWVPTISNEMKFNQNISGCFLDIPSFYEEWLLPFSCYCWPQKPEPFEYENLLVLSEVGWWDFYEVLMLYSSLQKVSGHCSAAVTPFRNLDLFFTNVIF